jgi:diguanylate cyclase (GGDEF)-like protein
MSKLTIIKPTQKIAGSQIKFENKPGSLVFLPLKSEGKDAGLLFLESVPRHVYSLAEAEILKAFAVMIVISLTREGLIRKTHELDIIDDLTSLYNIQYFRKRLAIEFRRAQQHAEPLSTMVIHIDNFEQYCQQNGEGKGEQTLVEIATIIRNQVRTMDIIARYSLNQIVTSLYNCHTQNAVKVADRVIQKMKQTKFTPGRPALGVSIGIASFPSTYAESEHDLLDCAEEAVYQAFRDGGFTTNVYK